MAKIAAAFLWNAEKLCITPFLMLNGAHLMQNGVETNEGTINEGKLIVPSQEETAFTLFPQR